MTIALQVLVSGLAAGGVYGLFAAGYSLVYRLTGIVHFAFGDLVGLGIFATLLVLAGTAPVSQSGAHEPKFVLALAVGLAVCILAGAGTYLGLVQPYLSRGSTIGLQRLGRHHPMFLVARTEDSQFRRYECERTRPPAAVRDALRFIEQHALYMRTGGNGVRQLDVLGIV